MVALRLLAARSVATIMTVIAAVTVAATLAGVVVIAMEMFISGKDLDRGAGRGGHRGDRGLRCRPCWSAGGYRRRAACCWARCRRWASGGEYRPPQAVLPAELSGLSQELATRIGGWRKPATASARWRASRRELVAWVSHDLRTPLAGLRAMAEALEDGSSTDRQTVSRYHAQIRRETDRLTLMIDDLFELSRIHAGRAAAVPPPVGLGDLISEALTSAEPLARAKGVRLRGSAARALPVFVDTAEVGRALRNLDDQRDPAHAVGRRGRGAGRRGIWHGHGERV